jgi:hypothetical protein
MLSTNICVVSENSVWNENGEKKYKNYSCFFENFSQESVEETNVIHKYLRCVG